MKPEVFHRSACVLAFAHHGMQLVGEQPSQFDLAMRGEVNLIGADLL